MSDLELLDRVKNKDREAFVEFMRKYGAKLYSKMLSKLGDRRLADAAFKETMIGFYKSLTENEGEDAVSALLSGYGDEVSSRIQDDYLEDVIEKTADCAESSTIGRLSLPVPEAKPVVNQEAPVEQIAEDELEEISKPAWIFAVCALSLCALTVLWVIIGLLWAMDTLPALDLGYSWFNNTIAEWF